MHGKNPVISVIMGIYNCGDTLSEAIECIVNQTFSDWELIMCDDGSNDDTYEIAISYKEKYPEKIIVLQNEKNRGLNYTLNKCLKQARGKYIARMDGDDRCDRERFAIEINVLEKEPEIAIVSTANQERLKLEFPSGLQQTYLDHSVKRCWMQQQKHWM